MVCLDEFMKNPGKISVRITLSTTLLYLKAVLVSIWFKKTNHWFIKKDYWLTSMEDVEISVRIALSTTLLELKVVLVSI